MPQTLINPESFYPRPVYSQQDSVGIRITRRPGSSFSPFQAAHSGFGRPELPNALTVPIPKPSAAKAVSPGKLIAAAGMIFAGLLLHRLPARTPPGFRALLPSDWKVWARVALGIGAIQKINQAFNWQPPPWLGGMQAVAVITPIAMKFNRGAFKQVFMLAPIVGLVVQAASELNKRISEPLQERFNIPPFITRMGISIGLALLGLQFTKALGVGGAAAMTCARGCTPGSIVCLSELGEMTAGMKNWLSKHTADKQQTS